ncbi:DNA-methyltransferase [Sulfitobacter pontiacus]
MTTPTSEIRVHCGSAVDVLKTLPAGSVDAAVFDPPYPTISGGSNADKDGKHQRPSGILTKNDGKIFDHNDIDPSLYLPEVYRVLRDNAHLYLMTNVLNLVERDLLGDLRRAGFKVHNLLFWRKNNATPNRWYMKDVELTVFARKGAAFSINNAGTRSTHSIEPHELDNPDLWLDDDSMGYSEALMEDFFEFPLDWPNVSSPKSHPTEKPVNLMRTYIENSTQPGETVLDPFMGTGSTGVASQTTDRAFIGIELDPTYCDFAAKRLGVKPQQPARKAFDLDDILGPEPSIELLLA